jgi:hypothetical protein
MLNAILRIDAILLQLEDRRTGRYRRQLPFLKNARQRALEESDAESEEQQTLV